jgi:hypothetical protein
MKDVCGCSGFVFMNFKYIINFIIQIQINYMSKFENPFKKAVVAGAIVMGASACAPGAGERAGAADAHDASMEQVADNSPESVQKRLLGKLQIGLNELEGGDVILVAMSSGLSIDGAEEFARAELNKMKNEISGVAFLPSSGVPKYERAGDGSYYVVLKLRGIKHGEMNK